MRCALLSGISSHTTSTTCCSFTQAQITVVKKKREDHCRLTYSSFLHTPHMCTLDRPELRKNTAQGHGHTKRRCLFVVVGSAGCSGRCLHFGVRSIDNVCARVASKRTQSVSKKWRREQNKNTKVAAKKKRPRKTKNSSTPVFHHRSIIGEGHRTERRQHGQQKRNPKAIMNQR